MIRCNPLLALCMAVCSFASVAELSATNILWGCDPNFANLDAAGNPMDAGFVFQIGVFAGSFTPTAENIDQWDSHWNSPTQSTYNPPSKSFGGVYTVPNNNAPYTLGKPGWMMGTRAGPAGIEKILFRSSAWLWPMGGGFDPTPTNWQLNGAITGLQVVFGQVNPSGSPFLMKAGLVGGITYAQWAATALNGEPLNAPDDDPDGDGIPNLLEFVFDLDPLIPNPPSITELDVATVDGQDYLKLTIPRISAHLASLTVQVSSDLTFWQDGPTFTEEISNTPTEWVVRDKAPIPAASGKRLIRLKAALPPSP